MSNLEVRNKMIDLKEKMLIENLEVMQDFNEHLKRLLAELQMRDLCNIETTDLIKMINELYKNIIQASAVASSKGGS
jgi:hypothetical protein